MSSVANHIESIEVVNTSPVPPVPESLEDAGVSTSTVESLVLKYLYFRGDLIGRDISHLLGFPFSLVDDLIENLKRQHYVGVRKSLGVGNASGIFALTEAGRTLTREHLENNQYAGPAPVPLYQYTEMVRHQKLKSNWLSPELLQEGQ